MTAIYRHSAGRISSNKQIRSASVPLALLLVTLLLCWPTVALPQGALENPHSKLLQQPTVALPQGELANPHSKLLQQPSVALPQGALENPHSDHLQQPAVRQHAVLPGPRHVSARDMMLVSGTNSGSQGFLGTIASSPGYAFLASALVPGLGQAANGQWWKTAVFASVEAAAIVTYINRENKGRAGERRYISFGNQQWSVIQYAQYIISNHQHEHGMTFRDLLSPEYFDQYRSDEPFGGFEPLFDHKAEWSIIDLDALNRAERQSRYSNGNFFSHQVEPYGSQQYYELMSKYFQFGPGWRQWNSQQHDIDTAIMPDDFLKHARIGFVFNDDLGIARTMVSVVLVNHFVSAFDALFTRKLRDQRIQASASMNYGMHPTIGLQYRF